MPKRRGLEAEGSLAGRNVDERWGKYDGGAFELKTYAVVRGPGPSKRLPKSSGPHDEE
jgi:hypothetical protein